jgi:hypothetical protein
MKLVMALEETNSEFVRAVMAGVFNNAVTFFLKV